MTAFPGDKKSAIRLSLKKPTNLMSHFFERLNSLFYLFFCFQRRTQSKSPVFLSRKRLIQKQLSRCFINKEFLRRGRPERLPSRRGFPIWERERAAYPVMTLFLVDCFFKRTEHNSTKKQKNKYFFGRKNIPQQKSGFIICYLSSII